MDAITLQDEINDLTNYISFFTTMQNNIPTRINNISLHSKSNLKSNKISVLNSLNDELTARLSNLNTILQTAQNNLAEIQSGALPPMGPPPSASEVVNPVSPGHPAPAIKG